MPAENIVITVVSDGEEHELHTFPGEYRNLMVLIYDKIYIEDFGDCRGMGRCGTCLIEVLECAVPLQSLGRNEETTLAKSGINGSKNIRLACHIMIEKALNGARFKVLDM